MAKTETFTQVCSQVGSFSYAKYFTLYVVLTNRDGNSSTNQSLVDYNVYCQSSGSGSISANHNLYFSFGGNVYKNENVYVNVSSPNAYIQIASGTMTATHKSDGTLSLDFNASISASGGYGVSASKSGTFTLEKIPRYTTVTNSERAKTVNSISINWKTTDARDWTQYSLNGGTWTDANDIGTSDNKSGYYTISNLTPNTTYKIKTRCRRTDSQLWSEASELTIATYDIAKISSLNNFEHGSNASVTVTNPARNI